LKSAIRKISTISHLIIEPAIDRDTLNSQGTPEIISTIFNKIDACSIFVCDISIINSKQEGRKTPNPNVLVELGYAAKTLGWEKIICLYNLEFGTYEDLPFNIKQRRPLTYKLEDGNKSKVKEQLSDTIANNIRELNSRGLLYPELQIYYKNQLDKLIIQLIKVFNKLLIGYTSDTIPDYITVDDTLNFLKLDQNAIINHLRGRDLSGLQLLRSYTHTTNKIRLLIDVLVPWTHIDKDVVISLTKIVLAIDAMESFLRPDWRSSWLKKAGFFENQFQVEVINQNSFDEYSLYAIKMKVGGSFSTIDFGLFKNIDATCLLDSFRPSDHYLNSFARYMENIIKSIITWTDKTNGVLMSDGLIINVK